MEQYCTTLKKPSRAFCGKEESPLSAQGRNETLVVPSLGGEGGQYLDVTSACSWLGADTELPLAKGNSVTQHKGRAREPSWYLCSNRTSRYPNTKSPSEGTPLSLSPHQHQTNGHSPNAPQQGWALSNPQKYLESKSIM